MARILRSSISMVATIILNMHTQEAAVFKQSLTYLARGIRLASIGTALPLLSHITQTCTPGRLPIKASYGALPFLYATTSTQATQQQSASQALTVSLQIDTLIKGIKTDIVRLHYFIEGCLSGLDEQNEKHVKPSVILPHMLEQAARTTLKNGTPIVSTIDPHIFVNKTLNWSGRLAEFDKVFEDAVALHGSSKEGLQLAWKTVAQYLKEEGLQKPTGTYCLNLARKDDARLKHIEQGKKTTFLFRTPKYRDLSAASLFKGEIR